MKVFICTDEENKVTMWADRRSMDEEIELDIPNDHPFISSNPTHYILKDGELIRNDGYILEKTKKKKDLELSRKCNEEIENGFYHMINGIKYHFSYDKEAQVNFGDARAILMEGVVEGVDWTVTTEEGYERIKITKEDMDGVTLSVFAHKQENIRRYRDILLPMVKESKTIEEVSNIKWDIEI